MDCDGNGKCIYQTMVQGGQIYNFYLIVDGEIKIDPNQKNNGKANWIFVPLSSKNIKKAESIFSKPITLRFLKLRKLSESIKALSNEPSHDKSEMKLKT